MSLDVQRRNAQQRSSGVACEQVCRAPAALGRHAAAVLQGAHETVAEEGICAALRSAGSARVPAGGARQASALTGRQLQGVGAPLRSRHVVHAAHSGELYCTSRRSVGSDVKRSTPRPRACAAPRRSRCAPRRWARAARTSCAGNARHAAPLYGADLRAPRLRQSRSAGGLSEAREVRSARRADSSRVERAGVCAATRSLVREAALITNAGYQAGARSFAVTSTSLTARTYTASGGWSFSPSS